MSICSEDCTRHTAYFVQIGAIPGTNAKLGTRPTRGGIGAAKTTSIPSGARMASAFTPM